LMRITSGEIRDAARKYLGGQHFAGAFIGPDDTRARLNVGALALPRL
jgi:hypothetical protein